MTRLTDARERRKFEAFVEEILASPTDDVPRHLAELSVPSPYRLRLKVLYSRETISAVLASQKKLGNVAERHAHAFKLDISIGRTPSRRVRLPFAILDAGRPNMFVALAVCASEDWQTLVRFLDARYPQLVPVYLSQRELIGSIKTLRHSTSDLALRVREMSATEKIETETGKRKRSVREWTDEDLDNLLIHVEDRRQIINSLRFDFHRRINDTVDVTPTLSCKVTRNAIVEVSGKFAVAWNTVIADIVTAGADKLKFFSQRGLRDRNYSASPLAIHFKRQVFDDLGEVRRFVDVMRKYPHSAYAINHGNPYAHLQLSDRYDGSSFELWAVTSDEILVVPRLRATEGAVERLIHYIYDEFREGEVTDAGAA
ncbi:MAG TPA: hypothetical protein VHX14_23090 [Thermoanaerobaculia bacterium]|jgi:hypothetical protein|nr:hypothetical protein [Thermoanaerobaculia bacterium]